jgi:hypothetical protein
MTRVLTDIAVKIVPRRMANGNLFTELFHTWIENGELHHALSRVAYEIPDAPYARAQQIEDFKRRQLAP